MFMKEVLIFDDIWKKPLYLKNHFVLLSCIPNAQLICL
jgi:hypothetical protein